MVERSGMMRPPEKGTGNIAGVSEARNFRRYMGFFRMPGGPSLSSKDCPPSMVSLWRVFSVTMIVLPV